MVAYWLMKSEPDTFSIEDLSSSPHQTTPWEGVRNYQARNFMKSMQKNDEAFFYHSSCKIPAIVGTVKVVKTAYPDPTQFDPQSLYFDPKSTPENPRWYCVDVKLAKLFTPILPLALLKDKHLIPLKNLMLLRKGNRLSITPVEKKDWEYIQALQTNA